MRHAFTVLLLNKQSHTLEQLITDNEGLIDQIQRMKQAEAERGVHGQDLNSLASASRVEDPEQEDARVEDTVEMDAES